MDCKCPAAALATDCPLEVSDRALAMAITIIDMAEQMFGTSLGLPPPNNAGKGYAASHRKRESS